jgi:hypothetical protein
MAALMLAPVVVWDLLGWAFFSGDSLDIGPLVMGLVLVFVASVLFSLFLRPFGNGPRASVAGGSSE